MHSVSKIHIIFPGRLSHPSSPCSLDRSPSLEYVESLAKRSPITQEYLIFLDWTSGRAASSRDFEDVTGMLKYLTQKEGVEKGDDNQRARFVSFFDKFCVLGHTFLAISSRSTLSKAEMGAHMHATAFHAHPLSCLGLQLARVPSCCTRVLETPSMIQSTQGTCPPSRDEQGNALIQEGSHME
jgi:hypothetical protein